MPRELPDEVLWGLGGLLLIAILYYFYKRRQASSFSAVPATGNPHQIIAKKVFAARKQIASPDYTYAQFQQLLGTYNQSLPDDVKRQQLGQLKDIFRQNNPNLNWVVVMDVLIQYNKMLPPMLPPMSVAEATVTVMQDKM